MHNSRNCISILLFLLFFCHTLFSLAVKKILNCIHCGIEKILNGDCRDPGFFLRSTNVGPDAVVVCTTSMLEAQERLPYLM